MAAFFAAGFFVAFLGDFFAAGFLAAFLAGVFFAAAAGFFAAFLAGLCKFKGIRSIQDWIKETTCC